MRGRLASALEALLVASAALAVAACAWAAVAAAAGLPPLLSLRALAAGSVGSAFALEQTLRAATPLLLTGLAYALPARAGLMLIGTEGSFVLGGLAAAVLAAAAPDPLALPLMVAGGAAAGAALAAASGLLKTRRGIHEAIGSIILAYLAVAATRQAVEGWLRDPDSLDKPATRPVAEAAQIGDIGIGALHWGLPVGLAACVAAYLFVSHTPAGMVVRVHGSNPSAARFAGHSPTLIVLAMCALGGALAGLAGAIEVGAVQHRASASLVQGYGYAGVLVAMLARGNMLALVPAALIVGALEAGGGMLQRQLGAPSATASLMEGLLFVSLVACGTLHGRFARRWAAAWSGS